MPSCSPRWRASTRTSGRVIHRSCSRGSRAVRRRAMRSGIAAAAAARRACALAEHFAVVHATDVAPEQIAAAKPHARVRYSVAPAESSRSRRGIGGPGHRRTGAALVRCDGVLRGSAPRRAPWRAAGGVELSAAAIRGRGARPPFLRVLFASVVGPYWPPERRHVEDGYRTLPFPFEEIDDAGIRLRARLEPRAGRGLREQLVRHGALSHRRWARIPCRCCANRSSRLAWHAGASVPIRMPIGLRVGRLRAA